MITKCCDLKVKMSSNISVTGTSRRFGKFPKFRNWAFGAEIIVWVGTRRVKFEKSMRSVVHNDEQMRLGVRFCSSKNERIKVTFVIICSIICSDQSIEF